MPTPASPTPPAAPASEAATFIEQFAHRVATRDQPAPPPAHGYDQASLEALIAQALKARQPGLRITRALTQARICYALMQHPRLNTKDLAAAAGLTRLTVYTAFPDLQRLNLATDEHRAGRRYHFLTHPGEDWLLAVTR